MKKIISILLVIAMGLGMASCGKGNKGGSGSGVIAKFNESGNEYKTIDEMPDYTGDKFDVTVWYGYGTGDANVGKKATDDKFRDELERVTGIRIDEKNSFDNGGSSGDSKLAKMVATKSYPQVGVGIETSITDKLVDAGKLYDITELIPKYMPNYMKIINSSDEIKRQFEAQKVKGKHVNYFVFSDNAYKFYDKDYTPEKYANLIQPVDSRSWIWVRDDIVTKLYPNAKTMAEIKEIYMKNGVYTKEDLTDVRITSKEDFRTLLEKIDALGLVENGKKVWPMYTHTGSDNWDLMTMFTTPLAGKGISTGTYVNCFSYYDGKQDKMVKTAEQEWFKDMMKYFNQMIIDCLASKEALIDSAAVFEQKKLNGEYAVLYGNTIPPTDEQLKAAGKTYSYRPVMIDVPCDYNEYVRMDSTKAAFGGYGICFFKDAMTEAQVEHFLRFLDFFYSDAGMKFSHWGPEKAGLYEEDENGNLRYTDERFKATKVYGSDKQVLVDYGIESFPSIVHFISRIGINKYNPKLIYSQYQEERVASNYKKMWNYSYFEPLPNFPALDFQWQIWNFPKYSEGLKKFWNARQSTEDAMKTVFTATNDAEFEKYYQNMLNVMEINGYDDAALEDMTNIVKEQNKDLYDELKNWTTDK